MVAFKERLPQSGNTDMMTRLNQRRIALFCMRRFCASSSVPRDLHIYNCASGERCAMICVNSTEFDVPQDLIEADRTVCSMLFAFIALPPGIMLGLQLA